MSASSIHKDRRDQIRKLHERGYAPIPLHAGTKIPFRRGWQRADDSMTEWNTVLDECDINVGIRTGAGIVVVDCDSADIVPFVIEQCGDTPMQSRTPRGGRHLYYAMAPGIHYGGRIKMHGLPVDLRCEGHFVVCPWSKSAAGIPYKWLTPIIPAKELPLLASPWILEKPSRTVTIAIDPPLDQASRIRRARAYVARIPGAVAGQAGHNRTMRVAGVLIQKFGLGIDEALLLILEWNNRCEPPWSEKELLHKLHDAKRILEQSLKGGDAP